MGTLDRWKEARDAEKGHETHSSELPSESHLEQVLDVHDLEMGDFENKSVLAVGGGTGIVHLIENSELSVSIDPISEAVIDDPSASYAEVMTAAGEYVPFHADTFDWVICRNVLDHTMSPKDVLSEIRRVLKPDGRLWLDVNAFRIPKVVRDKLAYVDRPHPHHFSPPEVEGLLEDAGFEVVRGHQRDVPFWGRNLKTKVAVGVFRIVKVRYFCTT